MLFTSSTYFESPDFELQVLYSFTITETADLIRRIGETTRNQSSVWNKVEWTKRKWLTNEASKVRHCDIAMLHCWSMDFSIILISHIIVYYMCEYYHK